MHRYYITVDGQQANYIGDDLNKIEQQVELNKFYDKFTIYPSSRTKRSVRIEKVRVL